MESYVLSPNLRGIVGFCYKATFYLIMLYLVLYLFFIFSVIQGWVEQKDEILDVGAYIAGAFIVCIFVMAFYAIGYLWYLWNQGYRKKSLQGLITFVFISMLAGYIWFYCSEIKHREIRFKVF